MAIVSTVVAHRDSQLAREATARANSLPTPAVVSPVTQTNVPAAPSEPSDASPTGQASAAPRPIVSTPESILNIVVYTGDYERVGKNLFQLQPLGTLQLRYWWTTVTNYGTLAADDLGCTVVGTLFDQSQAPIDVSRSADCSLDGWEEVNGIPAGDYDLRVQVTLDSGVTGTSNLKFTVLPAAS